MAEDLEELDTEETEDAGETAESAKPGRRKTLFIIIGAALLVVIGGVAGAWFTGLLDPVVAMMTGEPAETATTEKDLPAGRGSTSTCRDPGQSHTGSRTKSTFLKMRSAWNCRTGKDRAEGRAQMTRIMDPTTSSCASFASRTLKGSAGMYRLREELLARVAVAVAPVQVNDVLFKEMLVN
jgi:flagellar FliL protein